MDKGEGTRFLEDQRAGAMGSQGRSVGLEVLSGHFSLSGLGPSPKAMPIPDPQDKDLQKREPGQTHPGSSQTV